MIIKIKLEEISTYIGDITLHPWPKDKIENLGKEKVTLSIKIGKRRKLVNGKLYAEPNSCPSNGLWYRYIFTPNDPAKFIKLTGFVRNMLGMWDFPLPQRS